MKVIASALALTMLCPATYASDMVEFQTGIYTAVGQTSHVKLGTGRQAIIRPKEDEQIILRFIDSEEVKSGDLIRRSNEFGWIWITPSGAQAGKSTQSITYRVIEPISENDIRVNEFIEGASFLKIRNLELGRVFLKSGEITVNIPAGMKYAMIRVEQEVDDQPPSRAESKAK